MHSPTEIGREVWAQRIRLKPAASLVPSILSSSALGLNFLAYFSVGSTTNIHEFNCSVAYLPSSCLTVAVAVVCVAHVLQPHSSLCNTLPA